jgi:CRP-like cAMP-binding protein/anti-anti-sigma regulatory factor
VKYVGNSLTLRSTVERGMREVKWLDQNGDLIQILVVHNYLFFGNSQSLLTYITTMFEEEMDEADGILQQQHQQQQQQPQEEETHPPLPKYLVVDFSLVTGMDTSAVDNIREMVRICQNHRCELFLAGLNPTLKSSLLYAGIKSSGSTLAKKYLAYTHDMETALAQAEDGLLSTVFHLEERNETESSNRRRERRMSGTEDDGFFYALQKIDEQHGLQVAEDLKGFQAYSEAVELEPGDILVRDNDKGLYFVETGLMRVQLAQGNTTRNFIHLTLKGPQSQLAAGVPSSNNETSIGHMNARSRTVGLEAALWKQTHTSSDEYGAAQSFRLARIGQGWVIGGIEAANGMKRPGIHVAITSCRLHHLPESAVLLAEEENPKLAMSLYKMISHLATKRQEMTIGHLGQHLRILNNPIPRLRGRGKAALAKIQNAEDPFGV